MQQEMWDALSPAEKRKDLYRQQKETLDLFLERNAITQEQYDKSLQMLQKAFNA